MNLEALWQHINSLHKEVQSTPQWTAYLAQFELPKERSINVFKEGLRRFIAIANLTLEERKVFFGNPLCGLHYTIDLTRICNNQFLDPECQLDSDQELREVCPLHWKWNRKKSGLFYLGDAMPSIALNKLLQGPTVIDCGLFCQLAVWFAIRYMLGDAVFDSIMHKTTDINSIAISRYCYDLSDEGNLLANFIVNSAPGQQNASDVQIRYVPNHKSYSLKHLSGTAKGHNCICIDNQYSIFDCAAKKSSDLSQAEVEMLLCRAFNAEQDEFDCAKLASYENNGMPLCISSRFNLRYCDVVEESKRLARVQFDLRSWKAQPVTGKDLYAVTFNLEKLLTWVDRRLRIVKEEQADRFVFWGKPPQAKGWEHLPHQLSASTEDSGGPGYGF